MDGMSTKRSIVYSLHLLGTFCHWPHVRNLPDLFYRLLIQREHSVRWLLDNGANPNARGDWDNTPLSAAVLTAPWSTIKLLMDRGGDIRKGQLLHVAAQRKLDDAIQVSDWLLACGLPLQEIQYAGDARSWMENKQFGMGTPLHIAVEQGDVNLVSFLMERGADPGSPDSVGRSARQLAQLKGSDDLFLDI
jgi:ankyrin repeat protein